MSNSRTHWRVKFRVEKRKGERVGRGRDRAKEAKSQDEKEHRGRLLVCELHRADHAKAPLKFFKELGRIQKTHVKSEPARAIFWRGVRAAVADVLIDLSEDFQPDDAHRMLAQVERVVAQVDDSSPFVNFADPPLRRPPLDPVLKRAALKLAEEEIRKNNL